MIMSGPVRTNIIEGNLERAPSGVPMADMSSQAAFVRSGLAPEVVAHLTAEALGTDQFWIFTHPELENRIITRNAEMEKALQWARRALNY